MASVGKLLFIASAVNMAAGEKPIKVEGKNLTKVQEKTVGRHKPKLMALIMHTSFGRQRSSDCQAFINIIDRQTGFDCETPNLDISEDKTKPNEVIVYESDKLGDCGHFIAHGRIDMTLRVWGDGWILSYIIAEYSGGRFFLCTDDGYEISLARNDERGLTCMS